MERRPGESANDRNDRAIRAACSWYQRHLDERQKARAPAQKKVRVVLLTQDAGNRQAALAEGLHAFRGPLRSYSVPQHPPRCRVSRCRSLIGQQTVRGQSGP